VKDSPWVWGKGV